MALAERVDAAILAEEPSIQSLLRRCLIEKPDNLYTLPRAIAQYIIHHFP
ncbi:MAG: hypothetical protein ACP5D7_04700 [Limnospira sp.]